MFYKFTLNLPNTSFPMKADLPKHEPSILKFWEDIDLYKRANLLNKNKTFVINDGPPYANGNIHIGHAFNKILKDIVIKYKILSGYNVSFVPGWDCHGLPIELNIEKKYKKISSNISKKDFRVLCREYASEQIFIQMRSFIRLGIIADWKNFYKTMSYDFEASIIESLKFMVENKYIYNGKKPVYWCFNCKSALAEAEIEYIDKFSSAIYAFFEIDKRSLNFFSFLDNNNFSSIGFVIWTTTAWTLPFNEAIALNPSLKYVLVKHDNIGYILSVDLLDSVFSEFKILNYTVLFEFLGKDFDGLFLMHPFYKKVVRIVMSDHVKNDSGSGCVHIAPAYGYDDYKLGLKYNLNLENCISDDGYVFDKVEKFSNLYLDDVNIAVIETLKNNKKLLFLSRIIHRYPHCWRHKSPLIFRTTNQWFIDVCNKDLRNLAMDFASDLIQWIPLWGKDRMLKTLEFRPDWCISRQRVWGVPIVLFISRKTGDFHPETSSIIDKIISIVLKFGCDAWYEFDIYELLNVDVSVYFKVNDVLDVWYDSSVVFKHIFNKYPNLNLPYDLCIEGNDQYRGWFQVSLLNSLCVYGIAPYKSILTHGFVLDGVGRKMSKSLNNVISPIDVVDEYGADILRLWVSSVNYFNDVNISDEILSRICESYRKVRNTIKFLLSNISDFDPNFNLLDMNRMLGIDVWILHKLCKLNDYILENYENYNFYLVYQKIYSFCIDDLCSKYLDVIKDRLYTSKYDSVLRFSAQSSLYYIICVLLKLLSPILSFTCEEAWKNVPGYKEESIFLSSFCKDWSFGIDKFELFDEFEKLFIVKSEMNKFLDNFRKNKVFGSSMEVEVFIKCSYFWYDILYKFIDELYLFFTVAEVNLIRFLHLDSDFIKSNEDGLYFKFIKSDKIKCERCWYRSVNRTCLNIFINICNKCIKDLYGFSDNRLFF